MPAACMAPSTPAEAGLLSGKASEAGSCTQQAARFDGPLLHQTPCCCTFQPQLLQQRSAEPQHCAAKADPPTKANKVDFTHKKHHAAAESRAEHLVNLPCHWAAAYLLHCLSRRQVLRCSPLARPFGRGRKRLPPRLALGSTRPLLQGHALEVGCRDNNLHREALRVCARLRRPRSCIRDHAGLHLSQQLLSGLLCTPLQKQAIQRLGPACLSVRHIIITCTDHIRFTVVEASSRRGTSQGSRRPLSRSRDWHSCCGLRADTYGQLLSLRLCKGAH